MVIKIGMRQSKVELIYILLVVTSIQGAFTSPAHRKNAKTVKDGTIRVSHEDRDSRYSKKINFNARQLSKRDKEYLAKLEDSLQSKEGKILFTNSWAVQLDPAEVAQADRIAEKHGFENLGQVISMRITFLLSEDLDFFLKNKTRLKGFLD